MRGFGWVLVARAAMVLYRFIDDISSIFNGFTCIKFCSPSTWHHVGSALSVVCIDVFSPQGHFFMPLRGKIRTFLEAFKAAGNPEK